VLETPVDPGNIVLEGNPDFHTDSMQPSPNYFGHLLNVFIFS